MPRPDLSARSTTAVKTGNPLVNWINARRERRRDTEERASRMITNQTAANEIAIIDALSDIDFLHSKLPQEILEKKTKPGQSCGDLEYAVGGFIHMLKRNAQMVKVDICKLDTKILTLVLMLKEAVKHGDTRSAYTAKVALIHGISDIRSRIPQNRPDLSAQYVEANANYLEQWITLVGMAQTADQMARKVAAQKTEYQKTQENHEQEKEELRNRLQTDKEYREALKFMRDHDSAAERSEWTPIQREVHRKMVERRMDALNQELKSLMLQQSEMQLDEQIHKVELLHAKLQSIPIVTDPNELNKFRESIDEMFKELAASDVSLDETLKTLDDIEGRIKQLNVAPGSIRAREVASEEAERAIEEIKKYQEDYIGATKAKDRQIREELGIYTDEELEQMRKQNEANEQAALERMNQEIEEQERQVLFN